MTTRRMRDSERSKASLWLTPLCCALFLGVAWLIGRIVPVPAWVYWVVTGLLGFTWLGDLANVLRHRRVDRDDA